MLKIDNNGLIRFFDGELVRIEPWGKNSLRVRATPIGRLDNEARALLDINKEKAEIEIFEDCATIKNGNARAEIDKNGKITFYNQRGEKLLEEALRQKPLKAPARHFKANHLGKYQLTMTFESIANEKIFGMGQYQQELLNLKGAVLELAHRNSQASVPFYLSSLGYGFLWNLPAIGEAIFGTNLTKFKAESTDVLDYLIIVEDTPAKIVERYMEAVGKPPKMPEYALGLWQSKLRYSTQEELMSVARKYKELGIPLSVIVCDFFHWPHQGDYRFDYDYFPDPLAMTKELAQMGTELMVSVWPTVEKGGESYEEMLEGGMLIKNDRGSFMQMDCVQPAVFYDATNPDARQYVWNKIKKNYYDKGIRLFWLDEAEPEYMTYDFDNHRYYKGHCAEVGNVYPVDYLKGFYEGLIEAGEKEPICLIRCAWAGSAKYGALVWSGDIMPTFEALRCQIRAGLNMAIAGIPWWTTDIGGFDEGDPDDEDYRELVVRWFEYATFLPVLRMHGYRAPYIPAREGATGAGQCFSGGDNELWSYGEDNFKIMKDYVFLRERLRPYLKEIMDVAHKQGTPPTRPLFYDFPTDLKCWEIEDQFMLGNDLLVCPVCYLGKRQREVYLPNGSSWIDAFSGEEIQGGVSIIVDAPIEKIPVFIRKGSELTTELFKGE